MASAAVPPSSARASTVVALPEPGACGWRVNPDQEILPDWLARLVDWHVRPSASPWSVAPMARVACGHVDWALVWETAPHLFDRRRQVGIPALPVIWDAATTLRELGHQLILEVQFEDVAGDLALAVYGAGVAGCLNERAWRAVAPLLTTCVSTLREPRIEYLMALQGDPMSPPTAPAVEHTGRLAPGSVRPDSWQRGDWMHTWWSYPIAGALRNGCMCPAHRPGLADHGFGPQGSGNEHR